MVTLKVAALPLAFLVASLLLLLQPGEAQFGPGGGFMPPPGGFGNFMPPPGGFGPQFPSMLNITCDQLNCAKGTCKINSSSTRDANSYSYNFSYSCQCENGWYHPQNYMVPFAPCALPNCTAGTNCSAAEQPPPIMGMPGNFSDPCSWAFCGGGTCVATSNFTYACNCKEGYKNLFNDTIFPCYSTCSIGPQCQKQGVGFLNATAGRPGSGGDEGTGGSNGGRSGSQASTAVPDSFFALLIMMLSLVMVIV